MTSTDSQPRPPYTGFMEELEKETLRKMATERHPGSEFDGAPADLVAELGERIEALRPEIESVWCDIHDHPELAFHETYAVDRLTRAIGAHGLTADVGVYGVDTAFEARFGQDGPRVGILSEFDALPGIGHGCGHNVIAAAGLGAVLALKDLADTHPGALPGTIVYLGTPAEEGHSGKEHMARGGAFAPGSLDACMMTHGFGYDCASNVYLGRRTLTVNFKGLPAHASAGPFQGRNALDAASLAYQAIGVLRQQITPADRIHAIITEGGERASVIPEAAQMKLYVRSKFPAQLKELSRRVDNIMHAAALMTDCGVEVIWDEHPPTLGVRANGPLEGRWVEAERRIGREPLPEGVLSEILAGSTDFGNVSYRVPGIHPMIKVSDPDVAIHTREFAQAAGGPTGLKAAIDGAYGLASTALDFLWDAKLRDAVKADFEAAGGAVDVEHFFD